MAKQRLTDRTLTNSVSLLDLIHIVKTGDTTQSPSGSSFKATVQSVVNTLSASTVTGLTFNNFTYDLTLSLDNGNTFTDNLGILASDIKVTGGTYNSSTGDMTFTNNSGGTFVVTGVLFTGNTSASCVTDLYVSNLYGCSPITVWDNLTLSGSVIDSQGGGYLDLRYGGSGKFYLGNDNGAYSDTFINGENGYLEMSAYDPNGRVSIYTDGGNAGISITNYSFIPNDLFIYTNTTSIESTVGGFLGLQNLLELKNDNILLQGNGMVSLTAYPHVGVGVGHPSDFLIVSNISGITFTTESARDTNPSLLSSKFSTIVQGVKNSVGLGGYNLNVNADNTAFVDNLNIKTVGTGTSVINLGLDINGNVVTGATTPTFSGGSGNCIADLYVTNIHGCSPITIHDSIKSPTSTATGVTSFAFGFSTNASGPYSTAYGSFTTASGQGSHAEGFGTLASGDFSHAQGYAGKTGLFAAGNYSHAEGADTNASGLGAHAEGVATTASGVYSHSEGSNTVASGSFSHAEGYQTLASQDASHAEGYQTSATTQYSHSEGAFTTASGLYSHSEGFQTTASGQGAHSEGQGTTASNTYSHAEGQATNASGYASHAEGYGSIAFGDASHAEGGETTASANYTHAEGFKTSATTQYAHSEGVFTLASGQGSHAEGFLTFATNSYSHAEGRGTTASGQYAHSQGSGTTASGFASFASGINSVAATTGTFVHSENSIVTGQRSVVLGGQNITGSTNDTVYVPYLNIGNIATGTSVINLGLDINGNVVTGATTPPFTGNTSASCITDLYISNLYGCSPITIHDDLLMITGTSVSSSNGNSKIELDYNGEPNKLNITSNYQNPIASIYLDSSAPNGVAKVVSDESTFNFGYDIGTIYTGITTVTNTGIGTGLTLNVSYNSIIGLRVLEIIDGGYGYVNGDDVIVLGSDIGGSTPADDQTLTIRVVKKPNDINLEGSNVHFKTYGDEAELGLPTITEFKLNSDYFWEPTVSIKTVEENDDRGSYFSMFPTGSGLQTKRVTNLGGSTFAESQSELSVGPTSLSLNSTENVYDDVTYTYSAQYASNLNISSGIINLQVDNQLNGQFNSIYIDVVNNGGGIINTIDNGNYIVFVSNLGSGICNNNGFRSDFIVANNLVDNVQTCDGRPTAPVIVSSENSAVLSGVTNSVILGGIGITADTNDTVYVPYLNIGNIATGTSVINLGLDINGNVVTGTTGGGGGTFTGNTSATCITDIYVTNIYGCSPLHIEPSGLNDVYITENGGNVGIGTTTPNYKLDVVGETRLSGAGQNILTIIGSGDTTPLFTVQGSSGELFTITDSLVGSLFSVNNISGLPILEVFDDDTILMGSYQSPSLNSSIKINPTVGLSNVYSLPMSAYTGAWFEYTVVNSSGARAGQIMSIFSGNTVNFTETTTTDIGSTTPITFSMVADGTTASLEVSATTSGWEVKTIIRSI